MFNSGQLDCPPKRWASVPAIPIVRLNAIQNVKDSLNVGPRYLVLFTTIPGVRLNAVKIGFDFSSSLLVNCLTGFKWVKMYSDCQADCR